tara:strand:+ start:649 stop:1194 length:546 start_codon:yes stop_codon:yes gene_type:complete
MPNIRKKKIYKNIYELFIKYINKRDFKEIKENYIYNGNSVSAICFNEQDRVFYFIRQMRPNYFFNKFSPYPLEIVAGGINKKESSRQAIIREIKEELGIKPISVKKLESLIVAPDILEEITDIYFAYVPKVTKFKIINPNEGEYIKIIPLKKKQILEILKTSKTQNIVTKYAFLKIKELKI